MPEDENRVLAALARIREGCQTEGWDSYHSEAISNAALETAEIVTKAAYVFPRSDGGINLVWLHEAFTIGINKDGSFDEFWFDLNDAREKLAKAKENAG